MDTKIQQITVEPYFDLEDYMNLARESRLESPAITNLLDFWTQWQPKLQAKAVEKDGSSLLAVWLPEEVEKIVDDAWSDSPSQGYLLNILAQYLCMSAVQEIIPQIASHGCAPSPQPGAPMISALEDIGLVYRQESGAPGRRYSVLTHYPFKGGCEVCGMQSACPKGSGNENFASVLLPGYERGKD